MQAGEVRVGSLGSFERAGAQAEGRPTGQPPATAFEALPLLQRARDNAAAGGSAAAATSADATSADAIAAVAATAVLARAREQHQRQASGSKQVCSGQLLARHLARVVR